MRLRLLGAALTLFGAHAAFGEALTCTSPNDDAVTQVGVTLNIGGFDCSGLLDYSGRKPVVVTIPGANGDNTVPVDNVGTINSFVATINPDPSITYALAVTNLLSTPLSVTLTITSPFTGGPYDTLLSSHQVSGTDGNGNSTISATPFNQTMVHQPFVDGSNVDGLNAGCTANVGFHGSGNCYSSGAAVSTAFGPTGATGTFGVKVSFTISPGDTLTASGFVGLESSRGPNNTPEPGTLGLLGAGMIGIGILGRRSMKKS